MNICVINGSPKGKYSITLQTVLYLQERFPECNFNIINVGQKIKAYEKDMSEVVSVIKVSDLLLFSYPVYTFIAPYQLHRFIELLKEEDLDLSGKYAAQITTSKHFYDITAHKYIKENCFDLKLRYVGGLSADMDDLLTKTGRTEAESFWKYILYCVEQDIYETAAIRQREAIPKYQASLPTIEKKADFPTAIVTNCEKEDESLAAMIADFVAAYPYQVKIINITDFPFSGGCLGCFHCATDGTCVYKDGFDSFLREKIQTNAAIVYAFSVKDHSMGATFKRYDDRQFCNGHRTVTAGMPMGYIVNGDYAGEANLQMIIEGRSEVGGNFLAGVATDSAGIEKLAHRLCYALENKLTLPKNFYGIGGMKIFRDLIYVMRGLMKADHKFYKKHGIYDFPQKKVGTIIKMKLVGGLLTNPKIKKKVGNKMNEGMIAPYKKAIEVGKKSN